MASKKTKRSSRSKPRKASRRPAPRKAARQAKPKAKAKARPKAAPRPKPAAPPAPPNDIGLLGVHLDFTTHMQEDVKGFYTEKLGFRDFNHDPNFSYLMVRAAATSSLGFMPPMQGMPEQVPPREPSLYFMVKDVEAAYRTLTSRGVQFEGPPQDMPWGHRVVHTRDPEGRWVWIAQNLR